MKDVIGATPAASDSTSVPPEFAGTTSAAIINRSLNTSGESATVPTTDRYVAGGDRLVIEIGIRDATASTTTTATISFGDNGATDLPEDQTTTTALNPWVEISQTLKFYDGLVLNNYQAVKVTGDGVSVGERIR